jgi:hypothetical protein
MEKRTTSDNITYIYIYNIFIETLPVKVQVNRQLHEEGNLKTMLEVHWMQQEEEEYVDEALDSLFVVVLIVIILF